MNSKVKRILIAASVVLFLIFVVIVVLNLNKKTSPPSTQEVVSWKNITPGISTENDVTSALGNPKSKTGDVLYYRSQSATRDNQISLNNGVVGLIKEAAAFSENRKTSEITFKLGKPPVTLYGPESVNGQYLFVYPDKGTAFIGNPIVGSLFEVWYFQPTTIELFMQKIAPNYSLTQQTGAF